jgi:hypothetical protein
MARCATSLSQRRPGLMGLCLAALLAFSTGCASSTKIYVKSTDRTNDGNTLYMMVRTLDGRNISTESYQDAVAKLFTDAPDPSVVTSQPLFPGNTVTVKIDDPDAKDVAVYFFFTQPGNNWRVPLRKPLPAEVYIDLGQHQIERVQVRKR